MPADWLSLIEANPVGAIVVAILLIMIGGGAKSLIDAFAASRRGIKGDALVSEQNGISGLGKLAETQAGMITQLVDRLDAMQLRQDSTDTQLESLKEDFEHEKEYTRLLIRLWGTQSTPPDRPVRL